MMLSTRAVPSELCTSKDGSRFMVNSRVEQVWEADYGKRELLLKTLGPLADGVSRRAWTTAMLYVNNNPYNLELFIVIGIDPDHTKAIQARREIATALTAAG